MLKMSISSTKASTGLAGLDDIVHGLRIGDNVVWQVDNVSDYEQFVAPYVNNAKKQSRRIVYIRFASHPPLLSEKDGVTVYKVDPEAGFEVFSTQIHNIANKEGEGVFYVFDCLSDLLSFWATDLMIGNFFQITCPRLFELDTIAYFGLIRNSHSFKTIARIRETTQLLLDVFNVKNRIHVHPLKVFNRYSPTMFLPHVMQGEKFFPITNSADAAKLFSYISKTATDNKRLLDYWDRIFLKATALIEDRASDEEKSKMIEQLCRIMIGREEKMLALARENFSIEDLLQIKSKMIGTGYIGGKAVGMLLARKILQRDKSVNWAEQLEQHDSFYIGSDVFYSYIVQNGWWKQLMEQKTPEKYFSAAGDLMKKLLSGKFPHEIREQFQELIEYFGQSPIIVRSSSLLEDSFGNVFAGKYESIFCVNQGNPDERYHAFEDAIRRIFASTMNEDALFYRMQKGLDQQEEQMALLVQRVSGSHRDGFFLPDLAGVGISYNTFVWNPDMDPKAGMLRLVYGLGTRAVNRVEDDYPRIVALDQPLLKPLAGIRDERKFSQHKVDALSTKCNCHSTVELNDLLAEIGAGNVQKFADEDHEAESIASGMGLKDRKYWIMNFDRFLSGSGFPATMQKMLKFLESQYGHPVDTEFTVNFGSEDKMSINLLQCRPLQTKGGQIKVHIPENVPSDRLIIRTKGNFMGGNISLSLKRMVYVDPANYVKLEPSARYDIARLIGRLNRMIDDREKTPLMLIGPGRWGTTSPSMGVPVNFSEINKASVLVELSFKTANLVPEISFGTHFFQDLVETDIFYSAVFRERPDTVFNETALLKGDNILGKLLPEYSQYADTVQVRDLGDNEVEIVSDVVKQDLVCFRR